MFAIVRYRQRIQALPGTRFNIASIPPLLSFSPTVDIINVFAHEEIAQRVARALAYGDIGNSAKYMTETMTPEHGLVFRFTCCGGADSAEGLTEVVTYFVRPVEAHSENPNFSQNLLEIEAGLPAPTGQGTVEAETLMESYELLMDCRRHRILRSTLENSRLPFGQTNTGGVQSSIEQSSIAPGTTASMADPQPNSYAGLGIAGTSTASSVGIKRELSVVTMSYGEDSWDSQPPRKKAGACLDDLAVVATSSSSANNPADLQRPTGSSANNPADLHQHTGTPAVGIGGALVDATRTAAAAAAASNVFTTTEAVDGAAASNQYTCNIQSAATRSIASSSNGSTGSSSSSSGMQSHSDTLINPPMPVPVQRQKYVFSPSDRVSILREHTSEVIWIAFSPDGSLLASASKDKTVVIWDMATNSVVTSLRGHTANVYGVAFNHNGTQIASGDRNGTLIVWNTHTRSAVYGISQGLGSWIHSVAFNRDGTYVAVGANDSFVCIVEVSTGAIAHRLLGHEHAVRSVLFSPDGSLLASGSLDNTVTLWDALTWQSVRTLHAPGHSVRCMSFSPCGRQLVSGGKTTIGLWDVLTGDRLQYAENATSEEPGAILDVKYSPDGATVATASVDGSVRLLDAHTLSCQLTFAGFKFCTFTVAFSPDGSILASSTNGGSIKLQSGTLVGDNTRRSEESSCVPPLMEIVSDSDDSQQEVFVVYHGNTSGNSGDSGGSGGSDGEVSGGAVDTTTAGHCEPGGGGGGDVPHLVGGGEGEGTDTRASTVSATNASKVPVGYIPPRFAADPHPLGLLHDSGTMADDDDDDDLQSYSATNDPVPVSRGRVCYNCGDPSGTHQAANCPMHFCGYCRAENANHRSDACPRRAQGLPPMHKIAQARALRAFNTSGVAYEVSATAAAARLYRDDTLNTLDTGGTETERRQTRAPVRFPGRRCFNCGDRSGTHLAANCPSRVCGYCNKKNSHTSSLCQHRLQQCAPQRSASTGSALRSSQAQVQSQLPPPLKDKGVVAPPLKQYACYNCGDLSGAHQSSNCPQPFCGYCGTLYADHKSNVCPRRTQGLAPIVSNSKRPQLFSSLMKALESAAAGTTSNNNSYQTRYPRHNQQNHSSNCGDVEVANEEDGHLGDEEEDYDGDNYLNYQEEDGGDDCFDQQSYFTTQARPQVGGDCGNDIDDNDNDSYDHDYAYPGYAEEEDDYDYAATVYTAASGAPSSSSSSSSSSFLEQRIMVGDAGQRQHQLQQQVLYEPDHHSTQHDTAQGQGNVNTGSYEGFLPHRLQRGEQPGSSENAHGGGGDWPYTTHSEMSGSEDNRRDWPYMAQMQSSSFGPSYHQEDNGGGMISPREGELLAPYRTSSHSHPQYQEQQQQQQQLGDPSTTWHDSSSSSNLSSRPLPESTMISSYKVPPSHSYQQLDGPPTGYAGENDDSNASNAAASIPPADSMHHEDHYMPHHNSFN